MKEERMPDFKEIDEHSLGLWLGGFFEAGGSMSFEIRNQVRGARSYTFAYPVIKFGDNNLDNLHRLQNLLGGVIHTANRRVSYQWYLFGERSVGIARLMSSSAPSREEVITAFENWENSTTDERVEIAELFRAEGGFGPKDTSEYRKLVLKADFVAGALDARGEFRIKETFHKGAEWGWSFPILRLSTTNRPLAEALCEQYGGSVSISASSGEYRKFYDGGWIQQRDSLRWTLGHAGYRNLINIVGDRFKLKTPPSP